MLLVVLSLSVNMLIILIVTMKRFLQTPLLLLSQLKDVDIVIGLPTILSYDLVSKLLGGQKPCKKRKTRNKTGNKTSINHISDKTPLIRVCASCTNPNERTLAKRQKERDSAEKLSRMVALNQALYRVHPDVVAQRAVLVVEHAYRPADDLLVDNHAEYSASDTGSDLETCQAERCGSSDSETCQTIVSDSHLAEENSGSAGSQSKSSNTLSSDSPQLVGRLRRYQMPETLNHGRMTNEDGGTCELCARLTVDKSVLLDPEPAVDEIDEPSSLDIDDVRSNVSTDTNSELPGTDNIFGTESLRAAIHELCGKYASIFSSKVKTTPALVQPLEIKIEGKDWSIPASRRAPRPQSREKLSALKEMIENLLRLKVIRHSARRRRLAICNTTARCD